jgi:hypothetical protein
MRTIVLLAVAALASGPLLANAAASTTEILQQRTADGRVLLTDRPSAGAKTERSWRMQAEDPAAARRRALDVKVEAQLVSERIERRMAQQQRLLDDEMQRRDYTAERDRRMGYDSDGAYGDGFVVFAPGPYLQGHHRRHGSRFDDRPGRDGRGSGAPRMSSRFTGPGSPGSR